MRSRILAATLKLPVKCCSRKRPSRAQLFSATPAPPAGGAPGCIHIFTSALNVPAMALSFL